MSTTIHHMAVMALGQNLKRLREKHGLTQDELAKAIGVSHPRISEIEKEHGNPKLSTITRLADFFGISPADLLRPKKSQHSA